MREGGWGGWWSLIIVKIQREQEHDLEWRSFFISKNIVFAIVKIDKSIKILKNMLIKH